MPSDRDDIKIDTTNSSQEKQVFLPPIGAIARPVASYRHTLGGSDLINDENKALISKLIATILKDPMSKLQLSDRVYQLLTDEIRNQKERSTTYRGRL
ncbi:hypothetical protein V2H45_10885 [Tumidithrix elongata RA019]|uniref:Uncharacterized protein n=1 Tax=Tumidithrix elongata BACA0141 TaxID=2716417 RepID=A0AAW9Q328_9CYAN|nr:hypothetical protein [Tumidithrix elongata RA019]